MKKIHSVLRYMTEPFLHLFVTMGFVILTLYYEHAAKSREESKLDSLNKFWILLVALSILFILVSIVSIVRGFQEKEVEENKKKQKELEIEMIKAENSSKIEDLKAQSKVEVERIVTESNFRIEEFKYKIEELKAELAKNNPVQVRFKRNYFDSESGKPVDEAYKTSLEEVCKAKKNITIIADYSPPKEPLIVTPKRQEYYNTILKVLEDRLNSNKSGEPLRYVRYMQRPDDIYKKIKANPEGEIIDSGMIIGDEQAFAHCKKVLELRQDPNKIDIELYVTPIIPSLPSILIVDDHKLLFTIPRRKVNAIEETKKGIDPIETAGVMDFTDYSIIGDAIVLPFKNIINSLASNVITDKEETYRIYRIGDFKENEAFQTWYLDTQK